MARNGGERQRDKGTSVTLRLLRAEHPHGSRNSVLSGFHWEHIRIQRILPEWNVRKVCRVKDETLRGLCDPHSTPFLKPLVCGNQLCSARGDAA